MKIVFVTPRIPFPPNRGDKIRTYNQVRHLARDHELHLVCFAESAEDLHRKTEFEKKCATVSLVELDRLGAATRIAKALASGSSLVAAAFADLRLARAAELAAKLDTDILWINNGALLPTLTSIPARHRIVDLVDVDSEKWGAMGERYGGLRGALYRREAQLTEQQEATVVRSADRCVLISHEEADCLSSKVPQASPVVIPNGVDLDTCPRTELAAEPSILFTGVLDYAPNIDAADYFATEILPAIRNQIPAARFVVAGSRPTRRLRRSARRHDFEIAANVTDIRPYFAAARLFVAPMRLGRGLQNKVLEAMAGGVPVVATPLALGGLAIGAQQVAASANSAADLAARCVEVLSNRDLALRLATSAHRFVTEHHGWARAHAATDSMLAELVDLPGSAKKPLAGIE